MFLKRIFAIAAIVCITASCRAENAEFERQVVMLTSPMHFNELKMTINANPSLLQGATGQLFLKKAIAHGNSKAVRYLKEKGVSVNQGHKTFAQIIKEDLNQNPQFQGKADTQTKVNEYDAIISILNS